MQDLSKVSLLKYFWNQLTNNNLSNIVIKAKKYLWQNFLKNPAILQTIVWSQWLNNTHVIEVWPGQWDLTKYILQKNPLSLTLIEIDLDMISLLEKKFATQDMCILHSDVLEIDVIIGENNSILNRWIVVDRTSKIIQLPSYTIYGNIPYYITSPILYHFLYEVTFAPNIAIFTMQKEVADRILDNKKSSVLSIMCRLVADVQKVCDISPWSFIPPPKVSSTCLCFVLKKWIDPKYLAHVLRFVKIGFSQKRKKLITNLATSYEKSKILTAFDTLGIDPNIRSEDLNCDTWTLLYSKIFESQAKGSIDSLEI